LTFERIDMSDHAFILLPVLPPPPAAGRHRRHPRALLSAAVLATLCAGSAHADERSELEALRATTVGLIQALVDQGLLNRDKADALLKAAQTPATAGSGRASAPAPAGWGTPAAGGAGGAPGAVAGAPIRVPYVSETVRAQIRDEVKREVLAQARAERWGDPGAMPEWLSRISIDGDVRVRGQNDRFLAGNQPAEDFRAQVGPLGWAPDLNNTGVNRERLTLRARVGITAQLSDTTAAGVRLATGSTSGPTSTSQTLGSNFNKYSILLDRAFLRWQPAEWLRVDAGRMPNPFYGTDLLWPDDIAFDGVAVSARSKLADGISGFATAGAFPLEEFSVQKQDKWLYGLQAGVEWTIDPRTEFKLGLAFYDFRHVEGVRESQPAPSGPLAGTVAYQLSQYGSSLRQKGNTLINLNDPTNNGAPVWGLASKFRPINLTAGLTLRQFAPFNIGLSLDWVNNSAFDLADIRSRAGVPALDLADKTSGAQGRITLGAAQVAKRGDWQAFLAYREFQRDAWVDGFTDTTWHLGGTNYRGFSAGGAWGFDNRSSVGLRWTSTRNLDDGRLDPVTGRGNLSSAPLRIDVLQVEVNSRF